MINKEAFFKPLASLGRLVGYGKKAESLFLVDPAEGAVTELPRNDKHTFTTKAENWEPGKIYVPPGAKILSAKSHADAWVKAMQSPEVRQVANELFL